MAVADKRGDLIVAAVLQLLSLAYAPALYDTYSVCAVQKEISEHRGQHLYNTMAVSKTSQNMNKKQHASVI